MNPLSHIWSTYISALTKTIIFILVLLFNFKLVEKTILTSLITRLPSVRGEDKYDFWKDVIVVNLLEGITGSVVSISVCRADRYRMLVLSTITCIAGLGLNSLAGNGYYKQVDLRLFYLAWGLMALAGAAQKITLQVSVADQLGIKQIRQQLQLDEGQRLQLDEGQQLPLDERQQRKLERQAKVWTTVVSTVAAIVAQFGPFTGYLFWKLTLLLMAAMVFCFIVFLLVTKCGGNIDSQQIQDDRGPAFWYKWLPLWICLVISSLVSASGSTLFYLEASKLPHHSERFSIIVLDNVVRVIELLSSEASSYVVERQYNRQKMELVRIGVGIWCSVLCCVIATVTATHRKYESGGKITTFWLIPQYVILGAMSGLAKDGFQSLCESEEAGGERYGLPFAETAKGFGSLLNVGFILLLSGRRFEWFKGDLDSSHLNDYYSLLSVLSLVNLMIFCIVALRSKCEPRQMGDEETGNAGSGGLRTPLLRERVHHEFTSVSGTQITPEQIIPLPQGARPEEGSTEEPAPRTTALQTLRLRRNALRTVEGVIFKILPLQK